MDINSLSRSTSLLPDDIQELRSLIARLAKMRDGLVPFYHLFPPALSTSQRKGRAARLDDDTPRFVRQVAYALERSDGLFADLPVDPERLRLQQELADLLRHLRIHFRLLERLCGDQFLEVQTETQGEALDVLQQVRLESAMPLKQPARQELRELALSAASDHAPKKGRKPRRPRRR